MRTPNEVPPTAMAGVLPVCSTTPPSCLNYLTDTLLSQGCRAPVLAFFTTSPPPRARLASKNKIPCHRNGGRTHHAAVTQAPGTMLLWPTGPVAQGSWQDKAAVCPHARHGGLRAAIAGAVL